MEKNKESSIPFDPDSRHEQSQPKLHVHVDAPYMPDEDPDYVRGEEPDFIGEEEPDFISEEDSFGIQPYEEPPYGEGT